MFPNILAFYMEETELYDPPLQPIVIELDTGLLPQWEVDQKVDFHLEY